MTGVRPGRRTTSMASPSIFRRRAQSVMRPTARSRWPCSAQCASNIGDLAGMRMYSVRVGTMASSQARWTKARVRSLSMVMDGYSTHPERIALNGSRSLEETAMKLIGVVAALLVTVTLASAQSGLERLYVLDCGVNQAKDQARWSPGVNEGKPIEFSDNCYLIRADAVAAMPDGMVVANGAITQRRAKTLAAQLTEIGVEPTDITYVGVSHTHGDHVGNVALFPSSTILIQGAEYELAMSQPTNPTFAATQKFEKLAGDRDVFGDGSVVVLSTPGHTPGHQSLLVVLPKTGALVLSGDAVHFRDNWEHRRVPSMNTSPDQTLTSLQRIADVLEPRKAQLWINHDKPQSAALRYAPAYYE